MHFVGQQRISPGSEEKIHKLVNKSVKVLSTTFEIFASKTRY